MPVLSPCPRPTEAELLGRICVKLQVTFRHPKVLESAVLKKEGQSLIVDVLKNEFLVFFS